MGSHELGMLSLLKTALTRVVMEEIMTTDQDQVDKYEKRTVNRILRALIIDDDEYFSSARQKKSTVVKISN